MYCTATVHHRRAVALVNGTNVLIKNRDQDGLVKNPALQVVRDQAAIMATIGGRFGLTPADRSSINTGEGETGGAAAGILD